MTSLGGSRLSIDDTWGDGGRDPGQTWPTPARVTRVTSIPPGPTADSRRTCPLSVTVAGPHPPPLRQNSITDGTGGGGRPGAGPPPPPPPHRAPPGPAPRE